MHVLSASFHTRVSLSEVASVSTPRSRRLGLETYPMNELANVSVSGCKEWSYRTYATVTATKQLVQTVSETRDR